MLFISFVFNAELRILPPTLNTRPANTTMMVIVTSSSTKVKPRVEERGGVFRSNLEQSAERDLKL
jgi:hypothetical protein